MSLQKISFDNLSEKIHQALILAGELAREEAIKTNTGIVVSHNGEVVTISAEELKAEKAAKKQQAFIE